MMTIFVITYNEQYMLPFFIRWYRQRFPDCKIVVYDNESTDDTRRIALDNNCHVVVYSTSNQLSDRQYLEIKNNCWKQVQSGWVIVCDCDELIDIWPQQLENTEATLFNCKGFDMCNVDNIENILNVEHGIPSCGYDKTAVFRPSVIQEINYQPGCHICQPEGKLIYGESPNLYHMKYMNLTRMIERYKHYNKRLSEENKAKNWGIQYRQSEEEIINEFNRVAQAAQKIRTCN